MLEWAKNIEGSSYSGTDGGAIKGGVNSGQGYELSKQTSKALVPM